MKQILTSCFLLITHFIVAQNVGIGNTNPQEMLSVAGGVQVGYTTTNNAGTLRYAYPDGIQYNTGFGWRSMVNNYKDSALSALSPFSSTVRNSYVDVSGVSMTITDQGTYLVIYKANGYNNSSYSPSGGSFDDAGIVSFMRNGGTVATRNFTLKDVSGSSTSTRIDFYSNPVEYSTVMNLSAGEVLKFKAIVTSTGVTPNSWTVNEAEIITVRLY